MTFYDIAATSSNYNANGFIKFKDNDSFINVFNGQTGVTSFINKEMIVIQRDSVSSFFLKSGDYVGYYNYHDVSLPRSANLVDLLAILVEWCTKPMLNNGNMVDMMNRLRTTAFTDVMNISTVHDKSPLSIDEITSSQGESSTLLTNSVVMASAASNGSYIVRQTKHYAQHIYGGTSIAMISGVLAKDLSASNVRCRIGVFDDENNVTSSNAGPHGNGMFFQWDSATGLSCVYRTNLGGSQVDTTVMREDWNLSPLIDSGTNRVSLYASSNTCYMFEWNSHDTMRPAKCGVVSGGAVCYAHQFLGPEVPGLFGHPSLPVRWEMKHASDIGQVPSSQEMVQGGAAVITDMDGKLQSRTFAKDNGTLFKTLTAVGTIPLCSIRLASKYSRSKLHPKKFFVVNTQQGAIAKWSILLNAVLQDATWVPVDPVSSWVEYTNTEVSYMGGTLISTGFLVGTGVTEVDISDKLSALSSRMSGETDTLTVAITYIQGTVVVTGGIDWMETE